MKRIGILGGLGPESTIAYYANITREYHERFKDYEYPDIVIYSMSFGEVIRRGYEMADEIKEAIESLARAGADFVVAACNSVHIVYDDVAPRISIPWFSIIDATAQAIHERGMDTVGLLGTVFTMGKGFYQRGLDRHGIRAILPDAETQRKVSDIIYKELVFGNVREESRDVVLGVMNALHEQGAQGVILGCTELPFLIQQAHTAIPVFDTTAIHSTKTLDMALAD